MKLVSGSLLVVVCALAGLPAAQATPNGEFCRVLRAFVASVQPDETREFTFRTSWGSNFKDVAEPAISAKRCEHGDYASAQQVCAYLMARGSTEFAGVDVKDSISCLSARTEFDPHLNIKEADFSFSYGSENRGALVDVTFKEDADVGGMAFRMVVDGY